MSGMETTGTDWSGLIGDLGKKVQHAIERPERDKADRLSILEKNEAIINDYELGSDPTMNKVIMDGVNATKAQMYAWKKQADAGEMSRAEYNSKFNTAMSGYKAFSTASKGFVEQIEASNKRSHADKNGYVAASPREIYMNRYNASAVDMKNTSMFTSEKSGKVYLVKKDDKGNIISQRESQSMLQYGNLTDENFYLGKFMDSQTKNIKPWTKETQGSGGSSVTIEAASLNEKNYLKARNSIVKLATTDDNRMGTILLNSEEGYELYIPTKDEAELNSILDEHVENERLIAEEMGVEFDADKTWQEKFDKMIPLRPDGTGVMQYDLKDNQRQDSKDIAEAMFEVRMKRKETSIAKRAPKTSGGGGDGSDDGEVQPDTYNAINRAWDNKSGAEMASLMKPGHTVKVEKFKDKNGKWQVKFNIYKQVPGTATTEAARDFVFSARAPEQLATYIYRSKSGAEAIQDYKEEERIAKGNKKSKAY
jgi:hypothetical protein